MFKSTIFYINIYGTYGVMWPWSLTGAVKLHRRGLVSFLLEPPVCKTREGWNIHTLQIQIFFLKLGYTYKHMKMSHRSHHFKDPTSLLFLIYYNCIFMFA